MRIPGVTKLRRLVRGAVQRVLPGSLVLLYHRVAERATDPHSLCVHPDNFAAQMEVLQGRVRPLSELAPSLSGKGGKPGLLAVTFDDGYADVAKVARPILERYDIPATVFITTGGVELGAPFWWDELEHVVLRSPTLPPELELRVRNRTLSFQLAEGAGTPTGSGVGTAQRAVRSTTQRPLVTRTALHRALHWAIGDLPGPERREALAALRTWAGANQALREDRVLLPEEIERLVGSSLFEIGAHSITHPRLPALSPEERRSEVLGSRAYLEAIGAWKVRSFAYPHGLHDRTTREIVREAGFEQSCTSQPGTVRGFTDPLRLPRIEAPNVGAEDFARFLHRIGFGKVAGGTSWKAVKG